MDKTTAASVPKTPLNYAGLMTDICVACGDLERGLGGLLLVGGDESTNRRFRHDFIDKSGGKYPVVFKSRDEFEQTGRNRQVGDVKYYTVELDKIALT